MLIAFVNIVPSAIPGVDIVTVISSPSLLAATNALSVLLLLYPSFLNLYELSLIRYYLFKTWFKAL